MTVLRRALQAFAAIWASCGVALIVAPRWLLVSAFDQPPYPDDTYVRVTGAMSLALAMLAVMVSRRDDAWWWSWAFAIATGLCATITTIHAVSGVPGGSSLLWWLFAGTSAALTASLVVGLTRASQEHPIA
jgi:fluoride ion exporter CrcB/FEX